MPTYGVIVHGIITSSINIKDQEATIQQMLADNYTVIPNAKIAHITWLTKEATLKRASSIVVEFTDPEMANSIIYAGMAWDGQIHQCQLYDRACRVKQCFRCYNYGHIGTQCNASQTCGYCTERHESKLCPQKGVEGFTPRCVVCKGTHTAWSNACPARRKEMQRVEQAKQARSIYWHVPLKEKAASTGTQDTTHDKHGQEERPARSTFRSSTRQTREPRPRSQPVESASTAVRQQDLTVQNTAPIEATNSPATSNEDNWETPATQREAILQPNNMPSDLVIDPQLLAASAIYPAEGAEEDALQEADAWLANMTDNNDNEWIQNLADTEPSPLTSLATDTRTAQGGIYKGCKCPSHQDLYSNWPTRDAELTVARCMRVCVYCGKDFPIAAELRKHMRKKYAPKNITVFFETKGKWSTPTPGWTRRRRTASPAGQSEARVTRASRRTRSQSLTDSPYLPTSTW